MFIDPHIAPAIGVLIKVAIAYLILLWILPWVGGFLFFLCRSYQQEDIARRRWVKPLLSGLACVVFWHLIFFGGFLGVSRIQGRASDVLGLVGIVSACVILPLLDLGLFIKWIRLAARWQQTNPQSSYQQMRSRAQQTFAEVVAKQNTQPWYQTMASAIISRILAFIRQKYHRRTLRKEDQEKNR